MWFTINPESSRLTPRTMNEMKIVLSKVRLHATIFWSMTKEETECFELSKIDSAIDLKGGFMR